MIGIEAVEQRHREDAAVEVGGMLLVLRLTRRRRADGRLRVGAVRRRAAPGRIARASIRCIPSPGPQGRSDQLPGRNGVVAPAAGGRLGTRDQAIVVEGFPDLDVVEDDGQGLIELSASEAERCGDHLIQYCTDQA